MKKNAVMNSKGFFLGLIVLVFLFSFSSCKKENQLPSCTITYPHNGDEFEQGDTIVISVEANDNDGLIAEVNFYIDDVGTSSSSTFPYKYSWNTFEETTGDHIIKVTVKDNEGGSQTDDCTISMIENATVDTTDASLITHNSTTSGGNISNDGGSAVTARGVCWSISTNPTISDEHTTDGSGTGIFASSITGLLPVTTYYVKAYATNGAGTTYGNEISFTTLFESGTLTDTRDGHIYSTVRIGYQWWMAENLKATHYVNGDAIPDGTGAGDISGETEPEYWFAYNDDLNNVSTYGRLYTWYTITDSRNVCPDGWHVPTDAEWTTLENYLRGRNVAGGKMKETGTSHWNSPNTGATNESGFTALPGGIRNSKGIFGDIGFNGWWWSSTEHSTTIACIRLIGYSGADAARGSLDKEYGFSVRCLRD